MLPLGRGRARRLHLRRAQRYSTRRRRRGARPRVSCSAALAVASWRARRRCGRSRSRCSPRASGSIAGRSSGFRSTTRGSTCTSRGTWPRARASPTTPGVPVAGSTAPLWTLLLGAGAAVSGHRSRWPRRSASLRARQPRSSRGGRRVAWGASSGDVALAGGDRARPGRAARLGRAVRHGGVARRAAGDGRAPAPTRAAASCATALLLGLAVLARPEACCSSRSSWLARPLDAAAHRDLRGSSPSSCWRRGRLQPRHGGHAVPGDRVGEGRGRAASAGSSGVREPLAHGARAAPAGSSSGMGRLALHDRCAPAARAASRALGALAPRGAARSAVPALVLVLHPLGMALLAPYRGPGFQEGRYSIHLLPLADRSRWRSVTASRWAVTGGSAPAPARRFGRRRRLARLRGCRRCRRWWTLVAARASAAARYAWAVQNIDAMQVQLGRWVAANTPPGPRVALNDVGAIAYRLAARGRGRDGLVTPAICRTGGRRGRRAPLPRARVPTT